MPKTRTRRGANRMTTATLTEPVEAPEADTTPAPSADTAAP